MSVCGIVFRLLGNLKLRFEFAIRKWVPKIFKRKSKKSETLFSIRLIPLGGFCQLAGEDIEYEQKVPKAKNY
jgi:membrane-associated protease RseP (regulator of RpoE activity)